MQHLPEDCKSLSIRFIANKKNKRKNRSNVVPYHPAPRGVAKINIPRPAQLITLLISHSSHTRFASLDLAEELLERVGVERYVYEVGAVGSAPRARELVVDKLRDVGVICQLLSQHTIRVQVETTVMSFSDNKRN